MKRLCSATARFNGKVLAVVIGLTMLSPFAATARQTKEVDCPAVFGASAETKSYYVNFCGAGTEESPMVFILTKKNGGVLKIPLNKDSKDLLLVKNGNYEYNLHIKYPPEPNPCECGGEAVRFTIKKAGKVVVNERVLNDRSGYFFLP
jgi:hypothetical protein